MKNTLAGIFITVMALFLMTTPLWAQGSKRQAQLYDYITKQNPYTGWAAWEGEVEHLDSSSHHGKSIKKYVNDIAYGALNSETKSLPYGSVIVQENYSSWGLTSITVMHKVRRGYNPNANDWEFGMFTSRGVPMTSERGEACLRCHKSDGNTDMLLSAFPGEYAKGGMVVSSIPSAKVN